MIKWPRASIVTLSTPIPSSPLILSIHSLYVNVVTSASTANSKTSRSSKSRAVSYTLNLTDVSNPSYSITTSLSPTLLKSSIV